MSGMGESQLCYGDIRIHGTIDSIKYWIAMQSTHPNAKHLTVDMKIKLFLMTIQVP